MKRIVEFAAVLAVLVLTSIAANCPATGACRDDTTSASTVAELGPGQSVSWQADDCSTCGHSWARVEFLPAVGVTYGDGNVQLKMQASCPASIFCCAPVAATGSFTTHQVEITEQNAKNLCGEKAPISWWVTATNNYSVPITNVKLTINCKKGKTSTPTSPS